MLDDFKRYIFYFLGGASKGKPRGLSAPVLFCGWFGGRGAMELSSQRPQQAGELRCLELLWVFAATGVAGVGFSMRGGYGAAGAIGEEKWTREKACNR